MRLLLLILSFAFVSVANSATYYLDAVDGNDTTGNGSQAQPWQTLSKAQSVGVSGDVFNLETGDYGNYTEVDVARTSYIIYQPVDGATVHFDYISIFNTSPTNTYLKFKGINILPEDVSQTVDPQLSTSTQATYNKTARPVNLSKVNYFQIIDSDVGGNNHWLTDAVVYTDSSNNMLFENIYAHTAWHGFRFISTGANITVRGCRITDLTGTGINTVGLGYSNLLYENNHIYDNCIASYTEDYSPKADGANIHGSGISVRDGNTTIRGNILRNTGSSSGIMFYEDDAGNDYVNSNILMENNLIYDLPSYYPLRIYELGANVVIRNNVVVGRHHATSGNLTYRTAMLVHGVDDGDGTPSLEMYNNIMIGQTTVIREYTTESNNIFWAYYRDGETSVCTGDGGLSPDSIAYSCYHTLTTRAEGQVLWEAVFPNEPNLTFDEAHGQVLNFTIDETSPAYNFGSVSEQPSTSLGTIVDGFVQDDGASRTALLHSAGAYEYGSIVTPTTYPAFLINGTAHKLLGD